MPGCASTSPMRNAALAALLASVTICGTALAEPAEPAEPAGSDDASAEARWDELRPMLFEGKTLLDGKDVIELHAPSRALQAAAVPVAFHTKFRQTPEHYVKAVSLVIDANPAPLAAVFHFTPDSGQADAETRLRVDDYTFIHAVVETNDGKFYETRSFVKAAGGCSAPMSKDAAAAAHQIGQMRFRQVGEFLPGTPNLAQLKINHPNNSGMQMDQMTRLYIPAHYIRTISVTLDGKPIMNVDADISLSQNPFFRFYYVPQHPGPLKVSVKDNLNESFTSSWPVGPQASAGQTASEANMK